MQDHGATSQRPRKISAYFSTIITRTSLISFVPTLVSHRGALMTSSILSRTTPSFITIQTIHKCLSVRSWATSTPRTHMQYKAFISYTSPDIYSTHIDLHRRQAQPGPCVLVDSVL